MVRLGPSLRFVHNNLGFSLLGAGRTDEAVGTFREAIRRAPRFWPASLGLGRADWPRANLGAALDAVGRVAGITPSPERTSTRLQYPVKPSDCWPWRPGSPPSYAARTGRRRHRTRRVRPALLFQTSHATSARLGPKCSPRNPGSPTTWRPIIASKPLVSRLWPAAVLAEANSPLTIPHASDFATRLGTASGGNSRPSPVCSRRAQPASAPTSQNDWPVADRPGPDRVPR